MKFSNISKNRSQDAKKNAWCAKLSAQKLS